MVGHAGESHPSRPLPLELTPFIGRRKERVRVRELLSDHRLVTLAGFGGIGKSRLALRVATDVRRAFSDGVLFIPLAGVDDPDWLAQSVATQLGLHGRSAQSAWSSVVDYLEPRTMLLVLDNCEHLVDAAADFVESLLVRCPHVKVLTTSREPLGVTGEAVHQVEGLSRPPPGPTDDKPLVGYECARLFVDRARQIQGSFDITDDNREDVAELCRVLEGIPLAVELAAARLRVQTPREILAQLTDHWTVLSHGSRTSPARQRTMAGCIEWSFDLCSPEEQDMWARVSVFAEGFEADAIPTVCDGAAGDAMDVLLTLVEKSIVTAAQREGRTRFRLLPPIRQRGLTQLREMGLLDEMRRRHRDWTVSLAEQAGAEWVSRRQVEWVRRLRVERHNLDAALEYCVSTPGEADAGLRMGAALREFGTVEGLFRPGREWFRRLLPASENPSDVRIQALRTAAWWAVLQGDLEAARRDLDEARRLAGDGLSLASHQVTQTEAVLAIFAGDPAGSVELLLEAAPRLGEVEAPLSDIAMTHTLLALAYLLDGRLAEALQAHAHCLKVTEPAGEHWYRGTSLWVAGLALGLDGQQEEAVRKQKESLVLKRAIGDRLGIGLSLEALAWNESAASPKRAVSLLGAAQQVWGRIQTSTETLPGLAALKRQALEHARAAMGPDDFRRADQAGRALSQEAAIDFALEEPRTPAGSAAKEAGLQRPGRGPLTRREEEVARLVQHGMTNPQIAEALVISKRTAETHVENILTKLGFTNRHQIAAWVAERPPEPEQVSSTTA